MIRFKILVLGTILTNEDSELIKKSLKFFAKSLKFDENEIGKYLEIEDISAKTKSSLFSEQHKYVLILGNEADSKFKENSNIKKYITLSPSQWKGELRNSVINKIKELCQDWYNKTIESEFANVAKEEKHEVAEIIQNVEQFKAHVQLMIQNNRPIAAIFQDSGEESHCILRDATKRLKSPIETLVPIVIKNSGAQANFEKNFQRNGYKKIYFMEFSEFMNHITLMCNMLSDKDVKIIIKGS